jgi:NitT/TauT family transport system permease protein
MARVIDEPAAKDDGITAAVRPAKGRPRPLLGRVFAFRQPISGRSEVLIGVVTAILVLALWEISVDAGWIDSTFLPPPSLVMSTMGMMIRDQDLLYHAGVSTLRIWGAFTLSAVMAVPIGIMMSSYRTIGAALEPTIDFIRYLPVPALVPLSIIWFGVGEDTKIFLLWLGTFFQLVLLVADDMRRVPQEYIEISYTVGARPFQVMRDVALRAMLPNLVDNLRITLGWCWTYLIIAEIVAADSGLGFVIWAARRYMQTAQVMAGVVTIGLIGLVCDQLLRLLHRRMFRYL